MNNLRDRCSFPMMLVFLFVALMLSSCASWQQAPPTESLLAYTATGGGELAENAPVFLIQSPEKEYNLIGSPKVMKTSSAKESVKISAEEPVYYSEKRFWKGEYGNYSNLLYRIHFPEVPFRLLPFYLGAGKNVGLFVIVTLDENSIPVLYTTLHTCGCYLGFVPTSQLGKHSYPENWQLGRQFVYGEYLPGRLDFSSPQANEEKLFVLLRGGTHRIADVWHGANTDLSRYTSRPATIRALTELNTLEKDDGSTTSFYETSGPRKEYVKESTKIWERLLISWWAMDWRVGEDKRLGKDVSDGIVFYTSLKPWARKASDLRDFPAFLKYWGWRL